MKPRPSHIWMGLCVLLCASGMVQPTRAADAPKQIGIAAVQAKVQWYQTAEDFKQHMTELVTQAMTYKPQLIVFPEHLGTPLFGLGYADTLLNSPSVETAMMTIMGKEQAGLTAMMMKHNVGPMRAFILARAKEMRTAYVETFSGLARENSVYILAGTITLPEPVDSSRVSNSAYLFDTQGQIVGFQRKVQLVETEGQGALDLVAGSLDELQVLDTPFGKLGVTISGDCMAAEVINRLLELGAQVLVAPTVASRLSPDQDQGPAATALYARVQETDRPGVQCFAVGDIGGIPFRGISWILNPPAQGTAQPTILAQAKSDTEEEVVFATVTLK